MSKIMLIDAVHPEETRVALVADGRVDDFDFEAAGKRQLRGNIYLAKITRVEPSLQAAFVEYGGNRHGFLAFSEIHPDYYQLPQADREALLKEEAERAAAEAEAEEADGDAGFTSDDDADDDYDDEDDGLGEDEAEAGTDADGEDYAGSGSDIEDETEAGPVEDAGAAAGTRGAPAAAGGRRRTRKAERVHPSRRYKIQEVIRRRQVMLVQVVKEERGNKGAALTTYLSLAGRYCVLMPNTPRGGGISRKIASAADRKRLKTITKGLEVPPGMGLIVRTAGAKRTKTDIKRDFDYLQRLWDKVRDLTLNSMAPTLVNEEGGLVHRAMRDLYDKDIEEVLVQGEAAYREAKDLTKLLMPSQARKVKQWKDPSPLFVAKKVEDQLDSIFSPVVQLKSGGYLVINQTEALVAIDVNSGKSTRGRNIEQTATTTNIEAAEEACRQMRLRDLAGLIVIDFIDMDETKNNRAVEKRMKECLKLDRARVQHGTISQFGLMEISRQRRRTGVLESSSTPCESCNGTGRQRSIESAALQMLRAIEARAAGGGLRKLSVEAPGEVALYLLNNKREAFAAIEDEAGLGISVSSSDEMLPGDFTIHAERDPNARRARKSKHLVEGDPDDDDFAARYADDETEDEAATGGETVPDDEGDETGMPARRGRSRRRRGKRDEGMSAAADADGGDAVADDADEDEDEAHGEAGPREEGEDAPRRRRRRGRRGGRRRQREDAMSDTARAAAEATEAALALPAIDSKPPTGKDLPPEDGGAYLDGLSMTVDEMLDDGLDETLDMREPADSAKPDLAGAGDEDRADEPRPAKRRRPRGRRRGGRDRARPGRDGTDQDRPLSEDPALDAGDPAEAADPAGDAPAASEPAPAMAEPVAAMSAPDPVSALAEPAPERAQASPPVPVIEVKGADDRAPKKRGWWSRR